jgi:hypothetical protein
VALAEVSRGLSVAESARKALAANEQKGNTVSAAHVRAMLS